jgi:hypothetical protein
MKCTLTDDYLHDFASGRLGDRESSAVKKHCSSCPACAGKLRQIRIYYASSNMIPPALASEGFNAAVPLRLKKTGRRSVVIKRSIYAAAAVSFAGIVLTAAFVITRPSRTEHVSIKQSLAAATETPAADSDVKYDALTHATPMSKDSRPVEKKTASSAPIAFNGAERTVLSGYEKNAEDSKVPVYDLALVMSSASAQDEISSEKEMRRLKADARSGASTVPVMKQTSDIQRILEQRIISQKGIILSRSAQHGTAFICFEISSAGLDSLVSSLPDLGEVQIRHPVPASAGKVIAKIQIIHK